MTTQPPTLSEMEDYLAHYGVKGMKWGVTRESTGSSSSPAALATAAKVSTKKVADLGLVPLAATAAGVAFPATALLGLGIKLMTDPHVHALVKIGAEYAKGVVAEAGNMSLSELRS